MSHETYFWKIIEIAGEETIEGPTWNFKTSPYFIVDDMESYNDVDHLVYTA